MGSPASYARHSPSPYADRFVLLTHSQERAGRRDVHRHADHILWKSAMVSLGVPRHDIDTGGAREAIRHALQRPPLARIVITTGTRRDALECSARQLADRVQADVR
jgi:hypothetical protein